MKTLHAFAVVTALACLAALPAHATVTYTTAGTNTDTQYPGASGYASEAESTYDGDISSTDLINQGQDTYAGMSVNSDSYYPYGHSDEAGFNDGAATDYGDPGSGGAVSPHNVFVTSGGSVTFDLNTNAATPGGDASGFDITKVQVIGGYSGTFAQQNFDLSYTTTGGQTVDLGDFFNNAGGVATETEITDTTGTIASNVASLTFTFNNSPVVREIDVFGAAASVPEPSTLALMFGGLLTLLGLIRFTRKA